MKSFIERSNRFAVASVISLSVWIVANIINVVLVLLTMGFASGNDVFIEAFGFILLFSAAFSLPGIIIFWVVFLANYDSKNLFMVLLITALITSALSVLLLMLWIGGNDLDSAGLFVSAVISAIAAVIIHVSVFNQIVEKQNEEEPCIEL